MRKILLFLIFAALAWGKININEATRYELMTLGGLDAGRADMLMKYREAREISDASQFRNITGFGGYNTSKLEQNFAIEALPIPEPEPEVKKEVEQNIIIIQPEKKVYVDHPPRYRYEQNYGNGITIIEEGNIYGRRMPPPHYEEKRRPRTTQNVAKPTTVPQHITTQPAKKTTNSCQYRDRNGVCVEANVGVKGVWR